ncbi:MAG: hypothetical protein GTO18_02245 [Anaerolineales bacterium]|nr:hypothetical protein [Anaerolineales bacterium]
MRNYIQRIRLIGVASMLCAVLISACEEDVIDLETIAQTAAVQTAAVLSQRTSEPTEATTMQDESPTPPVVETVEVEEELSPGLDGAIAFISDRNGDLDLFITDPSGSVTTQFTNNPGDDYSPVWSPEDPTLAYVSARPGGLAMFMEPLDHSAIMRLSDTLASSIWDEPQVQSFDRLTWSTTGLIAYGSDRCAANCGSPPCPEIPLSFTGSSEEEVKKKMQNAIDNYSRCITEWWEGQIYTVDIYAVEASGGGEEYITFDQNLHVHGPAFTTSGGKFAAVVITADETGIDMDIYIFSEDGRSKTSLVTGPTNDHSPAWSPDGTKIAFVSHRDGNPEIYMVDADGENLVRLTSDPAFDELPNWSPDGKMIAFTSNRDGNEEVYILHLDDQSLTNITNHPANDFSPSWTGLINAVELDPKEQPGDVELDYVTTFEDFQKWFTFEISDFMEDTYILNAKSGELKFTMNEPNAGAYALYGGANRISDIKLQATFETLAGSSRNSTALVCRASSRGWYEFGLDSGGLWVIRKFDHALNDYVELASGGSLKIKMGASENTMEVNCIGRELSLWINDELISQAEDIQFKEGTYGIGVRTFDQGNAQVVFKSFQATIP